MQFSVVSVAVIICRDKGIDEMYDQWPFGVHALSVIVGVCMFAKQ